jgi:hypothetical protein
MATDCIAQVTFNFDRKRQPVVAAFAAEHADSRLLCHLLRLPHDHVGEQ